MTRLPDPKRSWLVLIGTSIYEDEKLPDLPAVSKSIEDLAVLLTDAVYGIVPEEHCEILVNEGDIRLIGQRVRRAADQAEDLLLIYYAGHGLKAGRRHDLYLALRNTEWEEPQFSALEFDKLRSVMLKSPALTKMIILDCCFSGRALSDIMADPSGNLIGQVEVSGSYVLASAQADKVALILPGEEYTAFTGRLLRLLRNGIPGGTEFLTIDDIYGQLAGWMKSEGLPVPHKHGSDTAGLLAVSANRAFAQTAVPAQAAVPILRQRQADAFEQGQAGNWQEAVVALREIAQEQARILGPEHQDTLRTRQFLGHAIGGAGKPLEAAELLRRLLVDQSRYLGHDHPETLQTRQFLAVNLGEAGYRHEAVAILRELLPDRRRILGNDDPHTLRTGHMLARNLAVIGATAEALAIMKEIAEARKLLLGAEHPHTVRIYSDLAALAHQQIEREDAQEAQ